MKNHLLPPNREHLHGSQMISARTCENVMISHQGPSILNKWLEDLKAWTPRHPKSSTRAFFQDLAFIKESPSARTTRPGLEQRVQDVDNSDRIRIQHHHHLNKTSLHQHPPPGEGMFKQVKSEIEPNLFPPGGGTLRTKIP